MGLIGENCSACRVAAEDPNGGGLAGKWWRGWARVSLDLYAYLSLPNAGSCVQANDMSGFIGAAVVGCFAVIVAGWYGGRWIMRRHRSIQV
jgi:high-affinity nickel-transport protein